MDGLHDIGGKQGFGPIATNEAVIPFHSDWEARMFALDVSTAPQDWPVDWYRLILEKLPAEAHLHMPYFMKWCMVYYTGLVDSGVLTLDEAVTGRAHGQKYVPISMSLEDALQADRESVFSYEVGPTAPARFAIGDKIRTVSKISANHTRLPGYARGSAGVIVAYNGAHILPDASADGQEVADHLYTVEFASKDLWGDKGSNKDFVCLDLWETYFD